MKKFHLCTILTQMLQKQKLMFHPLSLFAVCMSSSGGLEWCRTLIEEADVAVKFMHPHGPSASFMWPSREDIMGSQHTYSL